jgi:Flp pilus assembly protein TadD
MSLQEQYDAAMFEFSRGEFGAAVGQLKQVLALDPAYFDAQLALGMAYYRLGDFAAAIAEGLKAEQLRPREQLAHTNLSLFYMKSGDKVTAEHHGLQARIAGWRAENAAAQAQAAGATGATPAAPAGDPELQMAKPKPPPVKVIRMPDKFPEQPWKKKPAVQPATAAASTAADASPTPPHPKKDA